METPSSGPVDGPIYAPNKDQEMNFPYYVQVKWDHFPYYVQVKWNHIHKPQDPQPLF